MEYFMSHISLVFDVLITGLLGATIYFAIKLSRHLDTFRSNRSDMEALIRELSNQITRAQEGISVLDELATTRGDELRGIVAKARGLSEELQLMTESGNSLAGRLEMMAVRNRELVEEMDGRAKNMVYPGAKSAAAAVSAPSDEAVSLKASRPMAAARYEETLSKAKAAPVKAAEPFFAIRDPDFEDDEFADEPDDGFASQAERDLAKALAQRVPKGK